MVGKCKWCGKPFTKTQTYRKKYKGMLPDSTLYGLGSGRLGSHTCYNWRKEYKKIQNEYVFLNIKQREKLKT